MHPAIIERYVDKVYAYAIKRTFSEEEAEELAQEILFTAVRELPKLRDESRFEPWLWGVAQNISRAFSRRMGRQRTLYLYDVPESAYGVYEESFDAEEREELYSHLRRGIAMLSSVYRNIIILFYYEGLSTKQIAEQLGIPEGTVTWRLSEARKKLKKECVDHMEESALRPINLKLDIYGEGEYDGCMIPFPSEYIRDSLSQSILFHSYEQPRGIEELAKLCGVPAYYIEERIANLVKREAVTEPVKGKYQTDFIIWSDKYGKYCEENAENALMPIMDTLIAALKGIADEANAIDFYKAGKDSDELFYLYGAMAFEFACEKYCSQPIPPLKAKYDGHRWNYIGRTETVQYHRLNVATQHCLNRGNEGSYEHTLYTFQGFSYKPMMNSTYINVCEEILCNGSTQYPETAARIIQDGYLERRPDGSLLVKTPAFTLSQKKKFNEITDKYLAPVIEDYYKSVDGFLKGYRKLFPRHLHADTEQMCRLMYQSFYEVIIMHLQRTGEIPAPKKGSICDVLTQYKKSPEQ